MRNTQISFEFIKNSFKNSAIVTNYSNAIYGIGLWNSEKHILLKYLDSSDNILIIGCGAGRVPIGLFDSGFTNIFGIDLSDSMIQKAIEFLEQSNSNINFKIGNAVSLPYHTSFFKGIFMPYNVLMHIPSYSNRLKALKEAKRVLANDSYLIFTTHNDRNSSLQWINYWDTEKEKWLNGKNDNRLYELGDRLVFDKGSEIFMHFPTHDEVLSLILDSGFKLIESKLRSEICEEQSNVLNFSLDCRFWVVS